MLSTPILAESVDQFLIKISNAMPTDCTLKDQVILFGHVSDHTTIPTVIHPNQTESFMMRPGPRYRTGIYKDKSILLTYSCDLEQEITLYANANSLHLDMQRLDVKNMWASSKSTVLKYRHPEIAWTLSY